MPARCGDEERIDGHSNFRHQREQQGAAIRTARTDGECLRYRLDVMAASAVDVAQAAGGWLYDRVMAGWEVTVLLPQSCDYPAAADPRGAAQWTWMPGSIGWAR